MPGFNAVPGQVCTYPGNIVPAMDLCSTAATPETVVRRSIRHRNHVVASPELFAERKMPLIIRTAIGDPDATYQ